jgi:hypothetical protein
MIYKTTNEIGLTDEHKKQLENGEKLYNVSDWYDIEWDENNRATIDGVECYLFGGCPCRAIMRYDKFLEFKDMQKLSAFVEKYGFIPPELMGYE